LKSILEKLRAFFSANLEGYRLVFFVLGGLALALGVFSLLQPTNISLPDNIAYQHVGIFTYSANAPTEIYTDGKLESGEVIFPAVTCQVDLSFYYAFSTSEPVVLQGTSQWTAELSSANGWKQTILSEPVLSFNESTTSSNVKLDVCQLNERIQTVEELTGVDNYQYTLTISPNIRVFGEVGGESFEGDFPASLVFVVESNQIYLSKKESQDDPLHPTQSGELVRWTNFVNNLSILSLNIPVPLARWIALGTLIVCLIALLLPELILKGTQESDEMKKAKQMFGERLVSIGDISIDPSSHLIQVEKLSDLVTLADLLGEKVLCKLTDQDATYYVVSGRTVYHYTKKFNEALNTP
jgi:hypothetical protein